MQSEKNLNNSNIPIKEILEKNSAIEKQKILYNEPMKKHTTFKIGGPAEVFIKIENFEDLKNILKLAKSYQIPITIIGNGSNILVLDEGIKGIVLQINLKKFEVEDEIVTVGAGEKIGTIAQKLLKQNLSGFEELSGIPGTIGGAIRINAGAYGKEMKDVVLEVTAIDYNGTEKKFTNEQLKFGYRNSILKEQKYIITRLKTKIRTKQRKKQ